MNTNSHGSPLPATSPVLLLPDELELELLELLELDDELELLDEELELRPELDELLDEELELLELEDELELLDEPLRFKSTSGIIFSA